MTDKKTPWDGSMITKVAAIRVIAVPPAIIHLREGKSLSAGP
mgnify:CR=1 FL=1